MKFKTEDEAMKAHDQDHDEPLLYWQEQDCSICEDRIDEEIRAGKRCQHGELIPNVADENGVIETDLDCVKCLEQRIDKSIEADMDFSRKGI